MCAVLLINRNFYMCPKHMVLQFSQLYLCYRRYYTFMVLINLEFYSLLTLRTVF